MGIVDYGKVTELINEVEDVFAKHELNHDEKRFILGQIQNRLNDALAKQKQSDMMEHAMGGGFMARAMKKMTQGKDKEDGS
jgi:hypothetical protein|tara:strand:+ start:3775 stop:4017 length:243 start_codon:yes stop_codon:yes gene_type:complete